MNKSKEILDVLLEHTLPYVCTCDDYGTLFKFPVTQFTRHFGCWPEIKVSEYSDPSYRNWFEVYFPEQKTKTMNKYKFQDVKRSDLLDKIEQKWTLRRKSWPKGSTVRGKEALPQNILADDWEGHPPIPDLVKEKGKMFLDKVLVLAKETPNSYLHNEDWPNDKFIKWDSEKKKFVHVFHYPEIDYNTAVSFSGDYFNTATFEIWIEYKN